MRLTQIMSSPVEFIDAEAPAETAWSNMQLLGIRHLVVLEGKRVAGIISDWDLGGPHGQPVRCGGKVRDLMTPQVVFVASDSTTEDAARLMRSRDIGCLPVVEDGRMVGIVTASDLLEILGEKAETPKGTGEELPGRTAGR
jgi:acetoin utilization protein AcuB